MSGFFSNIFARVTECFASTYNDLGTISGLGTTTAPTIGKIGQALNFNGTSSYVSATPAIGATATIIHEAKPPKFP